MNEAESNSSRSTHSVPATLTGPGLRSSLRAWLDVAQGRRFDAIRSPLFTLATSGRVFATVHESALREQLRGTPLWTVITCDRAESCAALITDLARSAEAMPVQPSLIVIRDGGRSDYTPVREAIDRGFGERGALIEATRNLGKRGFWMLYQMLFDLARELEPPHVACLQDDVELVPGWHAKAWSTARDLDDPELAVLYLLANQDDEVDGRWIRFSRREMHHKTARLTRWFDLQAFIAMPRMFELLDYRVRPIPPVRWFFDSTKSSGVGRQFTRRLYSLQANVYQVSTTLVYHGGHASLMNPGARQARDFDNRAERVPALKTDTPTL